MRTLLHAPRSRRRSIAAATLGALALVGSLLVATPAQALNDTGTGGVFTAATGRILDTAKGTGGFSTPMEAGKYRTIKVTGLAGVPDDGSVGAVSLNATVGTAPGYGTLFGRPDADTSRTSMLIYNGNTGEYVSNTATVAVGADGTIQIMAETSARVILDVQGYYTANTDGTAAGGFVPVAGKRFVDTRSGLGAPKATIAPGKSVDIQVTGANDVPAGASGAVVNLIAVNSTSSDGNLTPYATGSTKPLNSLHYTPSATTSIQAQVALSADGKMTITNSSSTINLVIDLQGYFTAAGQTGAVFTPGTGRAYDSRATGNTILAKNETRSIQIAGKAGVPVMGSGITAVVLTLIVAHGGSDGRAAVWADGAAKPDTTSINFQADEIRTNTVTVPLGDNGKISLNNIADPTNYVVDVQGWYTNPQAPSISCDAPFGAESVVLHPTTSRIACTITLAPATTSGETLLYSADSEEVSRSAISETQSLSVPVTLEATRGTHAITAHRSFAGADDVDETVYAFTIGEWSESPLEGIPSAGEVTNEVPYLYVSPTERFDFPEGATFRFYVTNDEAGSSLAWDSGVLTDPMVHVAGLPEGTYYWHADVTGTDLNENVLTRTTPTFSFVTSAQAAGADATSTAADAEGTYSIEAPLAPEVDFAAASEPQMMARGSGGEVAVPGCKSSDNSTKRATKDAFSRKHWPGVVKGGYAELVCGTSGTRGMRHIWKPAPGHRDDWIRVANKYPTGIAPESFMVGALTTTYKAPSNVYHQAGNDSYMYEGPLQIKDRRGKVVARYTVYAPVGNGNWKTITAYPRS
ncbi:hypothetical protein JG550_000229 [Curtobacterium flaccumfaciens pv. flaccumfaciens]|uniref:hypothetical protein n=1 Tax=Curtobacterium flaccumfaciens TaxID=2035 RepID=UPI001ADD00D8|nr:hypothetical protein [Curtobacterium flaccumfaciens]MBO9045803.1 hypothetical protein [Curtobacterium flaccumfaciens pv. flaccumfaciens]QTR91026.1 hypothetical protein JG550_000229 [Curtobacterium flaccumfaciens pv. flaccumfaciens]